MKKSSLYLKVTAFMLVTMLTVSSLSVFADETKATDKAKTETPVATSSKKEQSTDKKDIAVDEGASAIYEKYAENNNFILSISTVKKWIKITDKRTGKEWFSTPPGVTSDPISTVKSMRESVIAVQFTDRSGNENDGFSETRSRKFNGVKVNKIDGGVKIIFDFPEQEFTVPLEIKLKDDGFTAEVIYNEISERSESFTITRISIMPFFGSTDNSTDGYIFIPDGQGAIIDFKKVTGDVIADYNEVVYGRNSAKSIKAQTNFKEKLTMPVFGIKQNNDAFIAIIENGDARAEILAKTKGPKSNFNNIFANCIYRDYDNIMAKTKQWDAKSFKVFESELVSGDSFKISYNFLNNDKANYVGMAEYYRNYLIANKGMTTTAKANYSPLYLELVASIKRTVNIAGFPVDSVVPLCNYDDVKTIVDKLGEKDVKSLVIDYKNWYTDSSDGIIPNKLTADNNLGGKDKLNEISKYIKDSGSELFCNVDATDLFKSGNGISMKNDSTRALDRQPAMMYFFDRNTYQQQMYDKLKDTRFLLSPAFFGSVSANVKKYTQDEKFAFSGISDTGFSNKLYSDFGKKAIDRNESIVFIEEALKNYKEATGKLMVNEASSYAFATADFVGSVPIQTSNFFTFSETVPFYQILLQGYKPYSTTNLNSEGDLRYAALKALETGSSIKFKWVANNVDLLQDTIYDDMINCDYTKWIDSVAKVYKEISPITAALSDKTITNHEVLQTNVTKTTFSDGTIITINFSDNDVRIGDVTIGAQNYSVGR